VRAWNASAGLFKEDAHLFMDLVPVLAIWLTSQDSDNTVLLVDDGSWCAEGDETRVTHKKKKQTGHPTLRPLNQTLLQTHINFPRFLPIFPDFLE
jgi:hypothetical protein